MLRLAHSGSPIRVVEDHVASPTYAPALADRTARLIEQGAVGLFHIGGGEAISWYKYAASDLRFPAGVRPELVPTNEREYRTAALPSENTRHSPVPSWRAAGIPPIPSLRESSRDLPSRAA